MEKIELKDAAGKKVIKIVERRFSLSWLNLGVLELSKAEIAKGELKNSEIKEINSNIKALAENVETFANWFYNLKEKNKEDFLLLYKVVELIDDKKVKRELCSALLKEMRNWEPMSYGLSVRYQASCSSRKAIIIPAWALKEWTAKPLQFWK